MFFDGNDDKAYSDTKPTARQRGELIVKRLENFIRESQSSNGGVSYKRWQEMAIKEFTNAISDSQRNFRMENQFITRVILVGAVAIITIGFWGAIVAAGVSYDRQIIGLTLLGAGSILFLSLVFWGLRKFSNRFIMIKRQKLFRQIYSFDQQLMQLDIDLKRKLDK